ATPAIIEDTRRHLERLEAEIAALEREVAGGGRGYDERLAALREHRDQARGVLADREARLARENELAGRIRELRARMETAASGSRAGSPGGEALDGLLGELRELQGDSPMVPLQVDGAVVAEVVSAWTGIPLGRMVKDEIRTVRNLRDLLAGRVIGQEHAL